MNLHQAYHLNQTEAKANYILSTNKTYLFICGIPFLDYDSFFIYFQKLADLVVTLIYLTVTKSFQLFTEHFLSLFFPSLQRFTLCFFKYNYPPYVLIRNLKQLPRKGA